MMVWFFLFFFGWKVKFFVVGVVLVVFGVFFLKVYFVGKDVVCFVVNWVGLKVMCKCKEIDDDVVGLDYVDFDECYFKYLCDCEW